jgi:hypothetical protein
MQKISPNDLQDKRRAFLELVFEQVASEEMFYYPPIPKGHNPIVVFLSQLSP